MQSDKREWSITGLCAQRVSDKSIWPNQCLPWLMLASKVFCKICLCLLGMGSTTNSCGAGKHLTGNGKNTSCSQHDCETNVTLCKKHEKVNAETHRLYRSALRWKQRFTPGQQPNGDVENHTYLITVPEETETRCTAILNDMD